MQSLTGEIIAFEDNFAKIQTRDCRIFHVPKSIANFEIGTQITVQVHKGKVHSKEDDLSIKRTLLAELIN